MRLSFLVFFLAFVYNVFAQEPGNNLGKSITQVKQEFPNLVYSRFDKGYKVFKSKGEDEDFTAFYFDNGKLVSEETFIFDYASSGVYISRLYSSLVSKFSKYNSKHKRKKYSDSDITFFFFSNYIIKIANYGNQLQILYELKGYNINVTSLQAHP